MNEALLQALRDIAEADDRAVIENDAGGWMRQRARAALAAARLSPDRFRFEPASLPQGAFSYQRYMELFGLAKPAAKRIVAEMKAARVYLSDTYQVDLREHYSQGFEMTITWLSIKRRDREPVHDWRELQSIKNAVCGPEREAVELYPAESRLVDTANQFHLFVFPKGVSIPLGWTSRTVSEDEIAGARQRPFDREVTA